MRPKSNIIQFNNKNCMKKFLLFAFAAICATLMFTSCNNPKTTTVTVHVKIADTGAPAPGRLVLYTDDKAAYEKAIDTSVKKEPTWIPSEEGVMSDANGIAKVVLQLEKSKNIYFFVQAPFANVYNAGSTFVFKGFDQDFDLVIAE